MTVMSQARFCLLSLLLVLLAIGFHAGALGHWSRKAQIRAQAVSVAPDQKVELRAEAERFNHRASVLAIVGICLAVAGAVSLIISFRRHERAPWRSIPVALLVAYVLFLFVLV